MTDLTTTRLELATLQTYEARIDLYKEQVVGGYLGIGRTLLEAKASGVVPHGQWESWATQSTGMSIRNVQRCMQAAREIGDNSPLARLDMSKAMLLLSSGLDEDRRDALGAAAAEEQVPLSELKRRIEAARQETREAERAVSARQQQREQELHRKEIQRIREQAVEGNQHALEAQASSYRQIIAQRDAELQQVDARIAAAVESAEAARLAEVTQLRARLEKADSDRRAAHQELLNLKSTHAAAAATGSTQQTGLTLERFTRATRAYLMEVAELPYMGTAMISADASVRNGYRQQLDHLANWLKAAQQALKVVVIDADQDLDSLLRDGLYNREVFGG